MRIAIVGSGNVGGTLGKRWAQAGHDVVFSSRHPGSDAIGSLVADSGPRASAATVEAAVSESEVLLLATPWPVTKDILQAAGSCAGKVLIDATNPLLPNLSGLEIGTTSSGAERVAEWAAGARVVKAFNSIGSNIMANPDFNGRRALLFYCGDDAEAKNVTKALAEEIGFDARDAGPLSQARVLEPLALLWVSLAFTQGYGREFAFQIMNRP